MKVAQSTDCSVVESKSDETYHHPKHNTDNTTKQIQLICDEDHEALNELDKLINEERWHYIQLQNESDETTFELSSMVNDLEDLPPELSDNWC